MSVVPAAGMKKTARPTSKRPKKKGKRKSLKKRRHKRSTSTVPPCKTKSSSNTLSSGGPGRRTKEKSLVERMAKYKSMKVEKESMENFGLQLTIGDISPV